MRLQAKENGQQFSGQLGKRVVKSKGSVTDLIPACYQINEKDFAYILTFHYLQQYIIKLSCFTVLSSLSSKYI